MKAKLKVLKGSNAGKEVKLPMPECLIGRGEDCHMRPKTDAVSRKHCLIFLKEGQLLIRDLESKNGTFVNGEKIEGDRVLKSGDTVQFGPLSFEVVLDHSLGGEKKPKVMSIKEAAARTTSNSADTVQLEDSDISNWLEEADEVERTRRLMDPETRQLKLDETDQVSLQKTIEQRMRERVADQAAVSPADEDTKELPPPDKSKKKVPGKLPQRAEAAAANSRDAAAEMLKKFFNKR